MSTSQVSDRVKAHIKATAAIAEAIRALGEVGVTELYVRVMNYMDLATLESMLATLIHAKLIERHGHSVKWVGPKIDQKS